MKIIKHKSANIADTISIFRVNNQPVYSKNDKLLGYVKEVHTHPIKLTIEGIKTSSSIFSQDKYIGKNYIDMISERGVILNIDPIVDLVGFRVMDSKGKDIGKVKEVLRTKKTNSIQGIIVNTGILNKDVKISKSKIRTIGEKIMLSIEVK